MFSKLTFFNLYGFSNFQAFSVMAQHPNYKPADPTTANQHRQIRQLAHRLAMPAVGIFLFRFIIFFIWVSYGWLFVCPVC